VEHKLYIAWKDSYCIGIPIIDEQHRCIVSIINSIYYFVEEHRELDVLESVINMMNQYTVIHFNRANALKHSGQQHVIAKAVIPSSLQTFSLDAKFGRLFLKQV